MLRIGEFSVLSQISIYMLRHYDDIGLLIPEHVDALTGYRYYSEDQLPIANRIRALKSMGFGLADIKEVLTKCPGNVELKSFLDVQAAQHREKIELFQRQLTLIETTINNLSRPSTIPLYSVALKNIPQHNAVSCRMVIPTYDKEGILWEELTRQRIRQSVQLASPSLNIAIFHDDGFVEKDIDVEVQQAVVGRYQDTDTMKFKIVEPITAATLTFKGQYTQLPEANEEIVRWIADNSYRLSGPYFNIYHVSPETESIPENMITEVCFPVEPK